MYDTGQKRQSGKRVLKIIGYKQLNHQVNELVMINCGKCLGCRMDYAKTWANRCMLEAKQFKENYFVTLTYDDAHLHTVEYIDEETGEKSIKGTLYPKDLQDFFKKLRRHWEYTYGWQKTETNPGIRFYACGEYGDRTKRPHYHALIFNMPIPDKKPMFKNFQEDQIFTSKILEEIWGNGIISIGKLSWETCAYTARYVMKKQQGIDAEWYKKQGLVPEFVRMSRKPGIGRNYYEKNKDLIYESDEIFMTDGKGNVRTAKPPRYFDLLYALENPDKIEEIKQQREFVAKLNRERVLKNTSLTEEQYLHQKEDIIRERIKKAKRKN